MKKRWAISGTIAAVICGLLVFSCISATRPLDTSTIIQTLMEKGVNVTNLSASGKELRVELKSKGADRATPEDIRAIREIRNEARKAANKLPWFRRNRPWTPN